jgi:hypothetical protein
MTVRRRLKLDVWLSFVVSAAHYSRPDGFRLSRSKRCAWGAVDSNVAQSMPAGKSSNRWIRPRCLSKSDSKLPASPQAVSRKHWSRSRTAFIERPCRTVLGIFARRGAAWVARSVTCRPCRPPRAIGSPGSCGPPGRWRGCWHRCWPRWPVLWAREPPPEAGVTVVHWQSGDEAADDQCAGVRAAVEHSRG